MLNTSQEINELTYKIRGCIFEVYRNLGPGLLEAVYEKALMIELARQGLKASNQVVVPIEYKGELLGLDYRLDILVEDEVILELKSVEKLLPVHFKQIDTYLKLTGKKLGYLVNFNTPVIQDDIHRRIN